MFRWPSQRSQSGGCGMHTPSRDFVRSPRCAACSVIRERGSSLSNGAQKNALRRLRTSALGLVRPTPAPGSRSVQWRRTHPAGARGASCCVQALRAREARAAGVPGGQSLVHQALCLLRGAALPAGHHQGHCPGTGASLADGQDPGDAVHAGAIGPCWHARTPGDRYRRDLDPQGPHLPHRGERSDSRDGRSGSGARTAPRRAWRCSTTGWARTRPAAFAWR